MFRDKNCAIRKKVYLVTSRKSDKCKTNLNIKSNLYCIFYLIVTMYLKALYIKEYI